MSIEESVKIGFDESVLFLGAGFSVAGQNLNDTPPCSGPALATKLAEQCGLPPATPLEDASTEFRDKFGADALIALLKHEYTIKGVSPAQKIISSFPWQRIYTTNYDNSVELSALQNSRTIYSVTTEDDITSISKQENICVHFNGYIERLNRSNIFRTFKLTEPSYATASLQESEWSTLFREDIRYARAVYFIGYSLFDLDIRRLLAGTPDLKKKCFFILDENCDPVIQNRVSQYGSLYLKGTDAFSLLCQKGVQNQVQQKPILSIGRSIEEVIRPTVQAKLNDQAALDLFLEGKIDQSLIASSIVINTQYYCCRPQIGGIEKEFQRGTRAVVLHSNIANGKSLICEGLSFVAIGKGWRIFRLNETNSWTERELRSVLKLPSKIVLIIEEYPEYLEQIKQTISLSNDGVHLLLTARTATHDIFEDRLAESLGKVQPKEVNANTLAPQEISWWEKSLSLFGLWGSDAKLGLERRKAFLAEECKSQIHGILLKVLKSPHVAKKFSDAADKLKLNSNLESLAIASFVLSVLGYQAKTELLSELLGPEAVDQAFSYARSQDIALVDVSRQEMSVRSSVVAEFMLQNYWTANQVVPILVKLFKRAEFASRVSSHYNNLFERLMRYSSLQMVLPQKNRIASVVRYYEGIKDSRRCSDNPLFWLQYAIGTLVDGDLSRSSKYFDMAYAIAERKGWDTYQIDNHYARYLLRRAGEDTPLSEAFDCFRRARSILNRQMQDEKQHHPYRVATEMQPFIDRLSIQFSEVQKGEINNFAKSAIQKIEGLPKDRARNPHVFRCKKTMEYVLVKLG